MKCSILHSKVFVALKPFLRGLILLSAIAGTASTVRAARDFPSEIVLDKSDLFTEVVQTGRGNNADDVRGALNFRVRAFVDNGTGNNRDGDGIRNVDMIILDPDGREVQRRRENVAGYCAFGGGEPNCSTYVFADHDDRWQNGDSIRHGEDYTLRAIITAKDGRRITINRTVTID